MCLNEVTPEGRGDTPKGRPMNIWTETDEDGEEYEVDEEYDDLIDEGFDTPQATNYFAQFI